MAAPQLPPGIWIQAPRLLCLCTRFIFLAVPIRITWTTFLSCAFVVAPQTTEPEVLGDNSAIWMFQEFPGLNQVWEANQLLPDVNLIEGPQRGHRGVTTPHY